MKGKGRQGSGGKSSWGEARGGKGKGKPHAATEAWANRDATADAPYTAGETWSGYEGEDHAENAPRTSHAENAPWTSHAGNAPPWATGMWRLIRDLHCYPDDFHY